MRALVLLAAFASGIVQSQPAGPPSTDIYLVPFAGNLASLKNAKATPVATAPGYDNQPHFSQDGTKILFAANRDGKQIDIFLFDRANARVTQLTETPENENSPTYLPTGVGDAGGFSVVRTEPDKTQRLWRFDAQGRNPQVVLTDVKPVGYHAWIDGGRLALFVLGEPPTLHIATVSNGQAEVVTKGIGRSLHRIPGTQLVSVVQREPAGDIWVRQVDPVTKKVDTLVKAVDGTGNDRDMTWMPDGKTILMSSGSKVFSWTRGDAGWTEVFDVASQGLGTVSRIAVSPKGDAIALVVAQSMSRQD